ncbi:hypothetical protein M2323_001615 [Rhodoblastus acidophilus]|uniref:hypothetical protein n=1 Tax=Rhodoblastus acidophilus TaxID=1074 RepID=UPI002225ADAC|nr:hypothetical protein [Rhodoblastus acidophilus]MCW2284002.1 hypothetical protein [Rhodoblastus acidophilus]MCW2332698.1 hypothetical protein [Rhodoblastus acidophilus]
MFADAKALSKTTLRRAICEAGFEIADERVFGSNPHAPYVVARKRGERQLAEGEKVGEANAGSTPGEPA